jgi:hypothetical protein
MTATEHLTDKEKNGNGRGLLLRLSAVLKKTTKKSLTFIASNGKVEKVKSSLSKP